MATTATLAILQLILCLTRCQALHNSSITEKQGNNGTQCNFNQHCILAKEPYRDNFFNIGCNNPALLELKSCTPVNIPNSTWTLRIFFIFQQQDILNSNFINMAHLIKIYMNSFGISVYEYFWQGIDLDALDKYDSIDQKYIRQFALGFLSGSLEMYNRGQKLNTPETCTSQNYDKLLTKSGQNILSLFYLIELVNVNYKGPLCKFIFRNAELVRVEMKVTMFEFMDMSNYSLNSTISNVWFSRMSRLELTTRVLDPDVFENTIGLAIQQTSLYRIQLDLFKNSCQ